jgi:hypothetical protein
MSTYFNNTTSWDCKQHSESSDLLIIRGNSKNIFGFAIGEVGLILLSVSSLVGLTSDGAFTMMAARK